jgi:broad-specificity NMP kinase
MPGGVTANPIAVQLFVQCGRCLPDALIEDLSQRGHKHHSVNTNIVAPQLDVSTWELPRFPAVHIAKTCTSSKKPLCTGELEFVRPASVDRPRNGQEEAGS